MSYCRWSTNDFQCDLYIFDVGYGISINIAGNRVKFSEPLPEKVAFDIENLGPYTDRDREVSRIVQNSERENINLPYAGEAFVLSPEETINFLHELRELGYRFPDYVIETIQEEIDEEESRDSSNSPE